MINKPNKKPTEDSAHYLLYAAFVRRLSFDSEDGGDMFL
jgi:hypothetical protein